MEIGAYALSIVCVLFDIAVLIWNRRFTELSLAWERQLVRVLHWRSMEWFVDLREELLSPSFCDRLGAPLDERLGRRHTFPLAIASAGRVPPGWHGRCWLEGCETWLARKASRDRLRTLAYVSSARPAAQQRLAPLGPGLTHRAFGGVRIHTYNFP